ncbi:MAG: ester cyclase [Acidobacteria bacterium]|nr:ester cyclase [Acidobacteriota bacterium]
MIDTAKAPIIAYNEKDWDAVKAAVAPGFLYDEVGTQRKAQGINDVLTTWRGWATAIPDSKATFHSSVVSGNTVVLEVTWRGTHTGPLQTPDGEIAATGKKIEIRACQVIEVANDKAQAMRHYFDMTTLMQQLGVVS